ncbi:hypothetical protein [Roseburia sp. AF12-17LB]|uniref:hypothetical protein n=1 Tax=Roseburia sp. AF12-17LB TaxID=2293127 RepID=UPI001FAB0361|nr:hypothetical protein [Roseburia sp. AF12-17LB]
MKKRLFSILLALCMVLCLVSTTAFAESETEESPVCTCETACTAEAMNADCPICGAEGALPENCECSEPIENAEPEGEENEEQPETALTALSGAGETPAASGAVTEVGNESALTAAIANSAVSTVKLTGDISISNSLTVNRTVTLDLNGHVLKYESANKGSVIVVEGGGQLTIEDSNTSNLSHRFNPNGKLWVLDEASGTETVTGGVITGGTGYPILLYGSYYYYGGGVYIASGGQLTMTGGNIIGCSATYGGGVHIDGESGQFSMSGGSIAGCVASIIGGGVRASGTFKMSGQAVIRSCTAESATQFVFGGGVYVNGSSSFEMSGEAKIKGCQAISNSSHSSNGGGVYVSSSSSFVMSGEAKIEDCKAISNSSKSSNGGGVFLANGTSLTLSGNAVIQNCTATNSVNSGEAYGGGVRAFYVREITLADNACIVGCTAANGSGLYITGSTTPGNGKLFANGGSVNGDVVLGDTTEGPCTITGSGETVFKGKVTVTPGSTIENGKFNGEVINNGTITGGVFNSTVSGSGIINGGTFNGTPDHITGSGTETDPYQISTAAGLKWFRDKVNDAKTEEETKICAVLTAAIDLNNEPWTPIGNYTEGNKIYYEGTFDGGGHTISGLNVTDNFRYASLFGAVKGGTIKNLTVAGNVSHNYNLTGLACHVGGIVGGALDAATIENCSNNCSVTGGSGDYIGGIAGSNIDNARIIDCYNVGTITGTINGTGGVTWLNMGTISNCYNVGTIKTPYNSDAVGEIVGRNHGTVENCYYLAGTNLNAVGQNNSNGNITKTESKTAANFANDTVLALLKADRDNSPWDSCQYVAAAKITLPVFKGQGDEHTHNGNWTSNDNGTHSRRCTCNVVETQNCSGGTATCTQNAVCEFCKAEYGEKLPHDFTAETVDAKYLKSAATCTEKAVYYKSCAVCGLSSEGTADEATFFSGNALDHNWGAWTQNSDEKTHTRICKRDTSHTETENCIDANKDHKCDICDYIISECADDNKDHKCDYCGKKLIEHTGGKATCKDKAKCEVCGAEYGELDAKNHTDLKHFPATAATKTTEGNIEYWYCEGCGKYYSDKDGTKEIKKADTVTAKLKDDSKSPQTGDTSNLALWIALLFVSSGAAIGTTVVSRKKKYNK